MFWDPKRKVFLSDVYRGETSDYILWDAGIDPIQIVLILLIGITAFLGCLYAGSNQ